MNFLKRVWLSLINSKAKSIMLILSFLVIATLILSGLCIKTAVSESCTKVRRTLGNTVDLMKDTDKIKDFNNINSYLIPLTTAQSLAKLNHVTESTFISRRSAFAQSFTPYGPKAPNLKNPDMYIYGVTESKLYGDYDSSGFNSGTFKLIEGSHFTEKDKDTPCALIEQTLAKQDKLKLGDKITLKSQSGKTKDFKITGIYSNKLIDTETNYQAKRDKCNTILVPFEQFCSFIGTQSVQEAYYYIDDPINIDTFRADAKALNLSGFDTCKLDANDAVYLRMAGPLNNMNSIASTMVMVIAIAGAAILSLIIALNMKNRKFEVGVLLSLGERKLKIVTQMMIEILVTVIIGFSLSLAVGNLAAIKIGGVMFDSQKISATSNVADSSTGKTYSTVSNINISVTSNDIAGLYLAGILIALISAATPIVSVMRYNPKSILAKIE
jgi:putative ABC transport system permease protein